MSEPAEPQGPGEASRVGAKGRISTYCSPEHTGTSLTHSSHPESSELAPFTKNGVSEGNPSWGEVGRCSQPRL